MNKNSGLSPASVAAPLATDSGPLLAAISAELTVEQKMITRFAGSGGCAAKVGPGELYAMTRGLGLGAPGQPVLQPDDGGSSDGDPVLVGIETGDDAGVYRLGPRGSDGDSELGAIVCTADFITPPFDDPVIYGAIAAANAISDVYAMGGRPLGALNLCTFPKDLPPESARAILAGAHAKMREAGVALLGGHSVRGPELFFGLSVTGVVAPKRIWRNVGAQPGDALILTKPLGAGLIVTGARKHLVDEADRARCAAGMATLNRAAAEVLARFTVHAATDVTGFGLVGHATGMTRRGDVALCIDVALLPSYPGARALAEQGVTCGGAKNNRAAFLSRLQVRGQLALADEELIFDPQTSGGLLVAVPGSEAAAVLIALGDSGVEAVQIGEALPKEAGGAGLFVRA